MDISINKPSESTVLVRLSGKFTIEDINQFKEKTGPLAAKPVTAILMSFTDLDYVDSSGIGSLILLMNTAKNQGIDLILYNVQAEIKNVFRISHLDKFFTITTSDELGRRYPGIRL
ncbi:MAG TPA: STAS domain-containing protein [Spirochaetota bacterium]|nr:STAS domain-containing protein [Spirochaetota bacterium]HPC41650.1 STAS domain-containing protein [Spirochaetota bacterium]HPL16345.1 STAS domain-containing protein [Spirochaetota bacterium]HQF09325.1 STAS domain-containing protein [Spirochaetota bacterium]HQH98273.1 STAS domain-containing protein [Spirochaetota bacterium]